MDPDNPFGLNLGGEPSSSDNISPITNEQQEQGTIMSSHADPNPTDDQHEDEEIARIRARYAAHTSRLQVMETLPASHAIPGGRTARRQMDDPDEESLRENEEGFTTVGGIGRPRPREGSASRNGFNTQNTASTITPNKRKRESVADSGEDSADGQRPNPVGVPTTAPPPNRRYGLHRNSSSLLADLIPSGDRTRSFMSPPSISANPPNGPESTLRGGSANASFPPLGRSDMHSNPIAASLPGGDGVLRRKRPGFNRSLAVLPHDGNRAYREHSGDDDSDYSMDEDSSARARPEPQSAGNRDSASLLDRAATSLGIQAPSAGNGSFLPPVRPPVAAPNPPVTFTNPFLNPQPLPRGFRPLGATMPDGSTIGPGGELIPPKWLPIEATGSGPPPLGRQELSDVSPASHALRASTPESQFVGPQQRLSSGSQPLGARPSGGSHGILNIPPSHDSRPPSGGNRFRPEERAQTSYSTGSGFPPGAASTAAGDVVSRGAPEQGPPRRNRVGFHQRSTMIDEAGFRRNRAIHNDSGEDGDDEPPSLRPNSIPQAPFSSVRRADAPSRPSAFITTSRVTSSAISHIHPRHTEGSSDPEDADVEDTVTSFGHRSVNPNAFHSATRSRPPRPPRLGTQSLPVFIQATDNTLPRVSSDLRVSEQQATERVATTGVLNSQRGRGGRLRSGAPSPVTRRSPLPQHLWGQRQPSRSNMRPFADRDMGDESSADEATFPPRAASASNRGRGGTRGNGGRGGILNLGRSARQPSSDSAMPATTGMAGLGLGPNTDLPDHPGQRTTQPQPFGSIDGRAIYETPNGISIEPPPQQPHSRDNTAPKSKPKGGAAAMLEQLRQQAAAQMEEIQRQLKAAEEAALVEEAGQMDLDGEESSTKKGKDDIGDVKDWANDGIEDYSEDSEYEWKSREKKKKGGAGGGIMAAMKAAAAAMKLSPNEELDDGSIEHGAQARAMNEDEDVDMNENDDDEDLDEYEADYLTEDEESSAEVDPGEAMAREARRLLEQRSNHQFPPQGNPPPNAPQLNQFFQAALNPRSFQSAEHQTHPENSDFDENMDSEDVYGGDDQDEDVMMEDHEGEDYEEYDSEWEEDPTGYDDAEALAALGRPAANVADIYSALDGFGIYADPANLARNLKRPYGADDPDLIVPQLTDFNAPRKRMRGQDGLAYAPHRRFTFFEALADYPELVFELCKHMTPQDLLTIYSIQKDFHAIVNGHMTHVVKSCARYYAAESAGVFPHGLYQSLCIRDPVMRKDPRNWAVARWIPGLKWLQMVNHRERTVRDILACLARAGHRTPKSMPLTIKKIWLVMDIATTAQRIALCHSEVWFTDIDCYNAQFFIIKLLLMFNEPMSEHGDDGMMRIFLGQRGLTPLCKLLKREKYLDDAEILKLCVKYCYEVKEGHEDLQMFGVKPEDIGKAHLEGWGKGKIHLFRIDEIVMRESVRRKLNLDDHLLYMMLWGHVDPETSENIEPSYEEMYMSDDEDKERKRLMDAEKLRESLLVEGRKMIRKDYRAAKKKVTKERMIYHHKEKLAQDAYERGFGDEVDWDEQEAKDDKLIAWFMEKVERQMNANTVELIPGKKSHKAVDYSDIGDEDLPEDEAVAAYEDPASDSDDELACDARMDRAFVNLRPPTMPSDSSDDEYDAFDEMRQFDPTEEWSSDDEDHPGESLTEDVRDSGAIGGSGWVKNLKWEEDEPEPVTEDEFGDPVDDDGWWATTDEEEGEEGEEGQDDDDDNDG